MQRKFAEFYKGKVALRCYVYVNRMQLSSDTLDKWKFSSINKIHHRRLMLLLLVLGTNPYSASHPSNISGTQRKPFDRVSLRPKGNQRSAFICRQPDSNRKPLAMQSMQVTIMLL